MTVSGAVLLIRPAWRSIVAPILKLNLAHQISHGLTADVDALAIERALQQAAAAGKLACRQHAFAETFRPVGHERGVGRARHRIFRNALRRSKEAGNEIHAVLAWSGHDRGP